MRKKIMLIGSLNFFVKELCDSLSQEYNVQICPPDYNFMNQTVVVSKPDLLLFYLNGLMADKRDELIQFCKENAWIGYTPIVIIGSETENESFRRASINSKAIFLFRPISVSKVKTNVIRELDAENLQVEIPKDQASYLKKKHVLVVDDDIIMLRTMKTMLEQDYRVTIAKTGVAALTSIGREKPDLILLDYLMPMSDGKQVFEMIRADEETNSIPVIFLTGVTETHKIKEVLAMQPQGYILKSTKNIKVLERIRDFFEENPD